MSWLVPRNELTVAQGRAVEMDVKQHRLVLGSPGSGKTLVLLHRARHLLDERNIPPERSRIFVFTSALKAYIRTALDDLRLPADSVTTFDSWCQEFYRGHVDRKLPWDGKSKKPDFQAIRQGVRKAVRSMSDVMPLYDFLMVDEGQDLDAGAYEIMTAVASHLTVFMDHKQQLYENGIAEQDALASLGLRRHTTTLLDAYRCSPYVVRTAASFIRDSAERSEFIEQNPPIERGERQRPLLYLARDRNDERQQLIDVIRTRVVNNERIAILFPTRRHAYGYAQGLQDDGLEVEVPSRPGRRNAKGPPEWDFGTSRPKVIAYPSAKGLTFDTVLMPLLRRSAFPKRMDTSLLERWLFVGISRAVRWIYFSATDDNAALFGPDVMFFKHFEELERQQWITMKRAVSEPSVDAAAADRRDDLKDLF